MTMCEPLLQESSQQMELFQLTSSPPDIPASRSALPGSEEAKTILAMSGRKYFGLLQSSDRIGAFSRTLLGMSQWDSKMCLLTWKTQVTASNRLLFRLLASVPPTCGTGSGSLLPTPRAGKTTDENPDVWQIRKDAGKVSTPPLAMVARLWPTPKSVPSGPDYARANREGSGGDDLATAVAKMYPTPTAQDCKNSTLPVSQAHRDSIPGHLLREGKQGQLSADWVEALMGYPIGWTCIESLPSPSDRNTATSD